MKMNADHKNMYIFCKLIKFSECIAHMCEKINQLLRYTKKNISFIQDYWLLVLPNRNSISSNQMNFINPHVAKS